MRSIILIFLCGFTPFFTGEIALSKSTNEVTFLSAGSIKKWEKKFQTSSNFSSLEQFHVNQNGGWVCDVFGARSQMQVLRGITLYKFVIKDLFLENHGSQPIMKYHFEGLQLQGRSSKYIDQIRITDSGEIVGRWISKDSSKKVLAYSSCKPTKPN